MRKYEGEPDYAAGEYDDAGQRLARWQFFRSAVGWLILVNVAAYLTEVILFRASFSAARAFFSSLALSPDEVFAHGRVWQLLTYAFLHDPASSWHILFNMLFLLFFGIEIEKAWGTRRFLAFYLSAAVFAALCGAGIHYLVHRVSMCV
jgi:membrane associated rhomboid family serine protease